MMLQSQPPLPIPVTDRKPVDMRLLADLPSLRLRARYLVDGFLSGGHRSPLKGSSTEFVEYRDYQSGDELRRVDWRLWGRSDRLHVKQFEEETQLHVHLLLDVSASMHYSSDAAALSKLDFARTVLAAMAHLVHRQRDAFGVGLLGDELLHYLPARSSKAHLVDVMHRLDAAGFSRQADLPHSLNSLATLLKHRSLVIIASDFYDENPLLQGALQRLRYDHHEVIGLQIMDPVELDFPSDLMGTFVDMETQASMPVNAAETRKLYLEALNDFRTSLDNTFRECNFDCVLLRTDTAPMQALATYLAHRAHRL